MSSLVVLMRGLPSVDHLMQNLQRQDQCGSFLEQLVPVAPSLTLFKKKKRVACQKNQVAGELSVL